MKTYIGCALLLVSALVQAQNEKRVDSKITAVTVFLNKAQVTREIKTRVDAGKNTLIISGLSSRVEPQSLQISGKGNFIILGLVHQQNYLSELNLPRPLAILKDSIDNVSNQIIIETSQKEILSKEEQMLQSNQRIGGTNQNLTVVELKAMADFYRSRLNEIVMSRMKLDQKIKKLNETLAKLQRQYREQNEVYQRNTSEVVVSVSADAAGAADLELNYVVTNAGWEPMYDLRAVNTKSPVQLSYKANVFQSTGENWNNVKLRLSTANPNLGGLKPDLATWYLNFYQPDYRPKSLGRMGAVQRAVPAPETVEMKAEVAEEGPAESIADYTTTIQTSLNTEFEIALPYTVPSASKPTLVDIRNHELKADYYYSVAPKLDKDAFLLAYATGWEELSLLPGPANIFFEGTFVGNSYIDPNSTKDTLSISLGRDKRIVVKREKLKDFSAKKLIGTNRRESYAYEISLRNTKNEPVRIKVEENVPVSQNNQIEVTVIDVGGAKHNATTGKLIWEWTLQPNETKKATFMFDVKYPKDKIIAGLD